MKYNYNYDMTPVKRLMDYLGNFLEVSDTFKALIKEDLWPYPLDEWYHVKKTNKVFNTAFWLDNTYGRAYTTIKDKEGLPLEKTLDFFRPMHIMLHPSGYFSDVAADFEMVIAKTGVIVPFSKENFDVLKLGTEEVEMLANKILAHQLDFEREKAAMLALNGEEKYLRFLALFGVGIEKAFRQKHIASYLGWSKQHLCYIIQRINKGDLI